MARCSVKDCDIPAFCRPVLIVQERDPGQPTCSLELPLVLCCRHGRPGPVDRYLSPSSKKRIERALRRQGIEVDWRGSSIELRWTAPPVFSTTPAPLATG